MRVSSYRSKKQRSVFIILPADATAESLPTEVKERLGDLIFFKEFDLSTDQSLLGLDSQLALAEILAKGYYLVRNEMKLTVTAVATASNEPILLREVKSQMPRTLTMITGAGTSIAFGLPSTFDFTELIASRLREDRRMNEQTLSLYDNIYDSLKKYLVNPGIVTFEDIYQSIQDVRTISIPNFNAAFDEFRPRVKATHILKETLGCYPDADVKMLQDAYLDILLETFLNRLGCASRTDLLSIALECIRSKFTVWSFTLNYDNLINDALEGFTSGFIPGRAPRVFRPATLLSAIEECNPVHSHLHGSLKFGFPLGEPLDMFELHEYDSPEEGVQHSTGSRPSGRPIQSGQTLPPSPIITGLSKTELVFKQPFFTNFLAFFRALDLCSDVLIAGYGFPDRHVNMGIEQFRRCHPERRTYIVDKDDHDRPLTYFKRLTPDAKHAIVVDEQSQSRAVPNFPGWWRVTSISNEGCNTGPIFLWLRGFDSFCEAVVNNGFPE